MRFKRVKFSGLGVGSTSILMIFVVLSLTTFATLSFVFANADYNISEKRLKSYEELSAAKNTTTSTILEINRKCAVSSSSTLEQISEMLNSMENVRVTEKTSETNELRIEINLNINNRQQLVTTLYLKPFEKTNRYTIYNSIVKSSEEWVEDDDLNLWNGEIN